MSMAQASVGVVKHIPPSFYGLATSPGNSEPVSDTVDEVSRIFPKTNALKLHILLS